MTVISPLKDLFLRATQNKGDGIRIASDINGTLIPFGGDIRPDLFKFLVFMKLAGADVTIFSNAHVDDLEIRFEVLSLREVPNLLKPMRLSPEQKKSVLTEMWVPHSKFDYKPEDISDPFDLVFDDEGADYTKYRMHLDPQNRAVRAMLQEFDRDIQIEDLDKSSDLSLS